MASGDDQTHLVQFNYPAGTHGNIRVSGAISDGTAGGSLSLVVNGGTVTLTATNTYSGFTEIDGGTLLINGNNSGASGRVYAYNGGTLGGTGTIGSTVYTYGGTITGATATTVGQLTLQGDVHISTGEGDGIYLANLSGSLSDLLAITGTLFLGGESQLNIVGTPDGTTTYTLATFAAHNGTFSILPSGIPSGYTLVYNATDLELVPTAIPEASTWIGAALALGAVGFATRRKLRRA